MKRRGKLTLSNPLLRTQTSLLLNTLQAYLFLSTFAHSELSCPPGGLTHPYFTYQHSRGLLPSPSPQSSICQSKSTDQPLALCCSPESIVNYLKKDHEDGINLHRVLKTFTFQIVREISKFVRVYLRYWRITRKHDEKDPAVEMPKQKSVLRSNIVHFLLPVLREVKQHRKYRLKNDKLCLNKIMEIRKVAICKTCSPNAKAFFSGNSLNVGENLCRDFVKGCSIGIKEVLRLVELVYLYKMYFVQTVVIYRVSIDISSMKNSVAEQTYEWAKGEDLRYKLRSCIDGECNFAKIKVLCSSFLTFTKPLYLQGVIRALSDLSPTLVSDLQKSFKLMATAISSNPPPPKLKSCPLVSPPGWSKYNRVPRPDQRRREWLKYWTEHWKKAGTASREFAQWRLKHYWPYRGEPERTLFGPGGYNGWYRKVHVLSLPNHHALSPFHPIPRQLYLRNKSLQMQMNRRKELIRQRNKRKRLRIIRRRKRRMARKRRLRALRRKLRKMPKEKRKLFLRKLRKRRKALRKRRRRLRKLRKKRLRKLRKLRRKRLRRQRKLRRKRLRKLRRQRRAMRRKRLQEMKRKKMQMKALRESRDNGGVQSTFIALVRVIDALIDKDLQNLSYTKSDSTQLTSGLSPPSSSLLTKINPINPFICNTGQPCEPDILVLSEAACQSLLIGSEGVSKNQCLDIESL